MMNCKMVLRADVERERLVVLERGEKGEVNYRADILSEAVSVN